MNIFVAIVLFFIVLTFQAQAFDVAISEVFFDPVGADAGAEYVNVTNFGYSPVNVSGWDLYPDGIGYFTFPPFILEASSTVTIHLRLEGSNSAEHLYHVNVSRNMGNSSGVVGLFSSSTSHTTGTIVSYVRYYKTGSGERKTWESIATSVKIWTAGDFLDISLFEEGSALVLENPQNRFSSSGWKIKKAPPVANRISAVAIKDTPKTSDSKVVLPDADDAYRVEAVSLISIASLWWLLGGIGGGILAGLLFFWIRKILF